MLNQVVLQTTVPVVLDIDSVDPDEIVIIESISGLDPVPVTLFTGDFSRDGGYYQGRRAGQRNPVFNLKINPDYKNDIAVSDIREMIYEWFLEPTAGQDGLQVVLKDDRRPDRYFIGYTETIPADMFVDKPKAQISMLCVDPYLKSVVPYSMSDAAGWVSHTIHYDGSANVGLEMTLKVKTSTPMTSTATVDINGVKMILVKPSGTFAVNDTIYINTVIGSRRITLNGVDAMAMLTADSKWLYLNQGDNVVNIYGTATGDGKVVMTDHGHRSAWWGI